MLSSVHERLRTERDKERTLRLVEGDASSNVQYQPRAPKAANHTQVNLLHV